MDKSTRRKPDQEAHTPAILMWREACTFIQAANEIRNWSYRTPRLTLVAHGIELALKSFLRAKGYTLKQLQGIGHLLTAAVDECEKLGMKPPSVDDRDRINFLSEALANHEFRYVHTDRPAHMDYEEWISVAEWALRAAMPAVAANGAEDPAKTAAWVQRMEFDVLRALNPDAD